MKSLLLLVLLSSMVTILWAQSSQVAITLNTSVTTSANYIARDYVKMDAGFRFESGGSATFKASTNNELVFPNDYYPYSTSGDPVTRAFNNSFEVGTLPGEIDVSAVGDANYFIPIMVPTGTNSLEPSVGIQYNSSAQNGELGWQWSLNTTSFITRGPTSFFQEGYVAGNDFSSDDRFYLDGNQLIIHSGEYGADLSEYRTQSESFNRIKLFGTGANAYFKVWLNNGKILYYGSTENSRISNSQGTLYWYLEKIEDYDGKSIDYVYTNDSIGFRLRSINYSGNSILFLYSEKEDKNTFYRNGLELHDYAIVRSIEVSGQGSLLWTYEFNYTHKVKSMLNEIVLKDTYGNQYNSTIINWNEVGPFNRLDVYDMPNNQQYNGDFNGDGLSDFVVVNNLQLKVYIAVKNSTPQFDSLTHTRSFPNVPHEVFLIDAEKDSFEDIFLLSKVFTSSGDYVYNYQVFGIVDNNIVTKLSGSYTSRNSTLKLIPGDFDGNKDLEILVSAPVGGVLEIIGLTYTGSVLPDLSINCKVLVEDLNSDGKDDILFLDENLRIYEFNPSAQVFSLLMTSSVFNREAELAFADFNGDRYLDFLSTSFVSSSVYHLYYFTGKSLMYADCPFQDRDRSLVDYRVFFFGDFNGDGIADILDTQNAILLHSQIDHNYYREPWFVIHYGGSDGFTTYNMMDGMVFELELTNDPSTFDEYEVNVMDLNGDGCSDVVAKFEERGEMPSLETLFMSPNQQPTLTVKSITNGMNQIQEVNYEYLNASANYSQTPLSNGFLRRAEKNVYVVTKVKTSSGSGIIDEVDYYYKNATYNKLFGFVGFEEVSSQNLIQNKYNSFVNSFIGEYYLPVSYVSKFGLSEYDLTSLVTKTTSFHKINKNIGFTYYFKTTRSVSEDFINGTVSSTDYSNHDLYLNPQLITTSKGTDLNVTLNIQYSNLVNDSSWIIGRPALVQKTLKHTDDISRTFQTKYNYTNHQLSSVIEFYQSSLPRTTSFAYNPQGLVSSVTLSVPGEEPRSEYYQWDGSGRFIEKHTNNMGHSVYYNYNNVTGHLLNTIDVNGRETTYEYNGFGRLLASVLPDGKVVQDNIEFSMELPDAKVKRTSKITGIPDAHTFINDLGQVTETHNLTNQGQTLIKRNTYFSNHKIQDESLPYTSTARLNNYTYDAYGRPHTITLADGTGNVTYNYNGKQTTVTKPEGFSITTHDDAGFVKSVQTESGQVTYTYYSHGLVKTATAAGSTLSYFYNDQGLLTRTVDPDAGTYQSEYNGFGELIYTKDPNGNEYDYFYDGLGRLESRVLRSGGELTTWIYDPQGNIGLLDKIMFNNQDAELFTYDPLGRLLGSTKYIRSGGSTKIFSFNYAYDALGRLITMTYPNGYELNYDYNNLGFLTLVNDNQGQFSWADPTYNDLGMPLTYNLGNGLNANFTYDEHFKPNIRRYGSVNDVYWDFDVDLKGNLAQRKDLANGSQTETFTFDTQNRLLTASIGPNTSYYSNGNISSKSDVGSYAYQGGAPHALTSVNTGTSNYNPPNHTIGYTAFNKIQYISTTKNNNNLMASFTYGPDRNRASMQVSINGTVAYTKYYAGSLYEERVNANGEITKCNYIYIDGQLMGMYIDKANETDKAYHLHTDYLGSVHAVSDYNGTIVEEYAYDAWGKRRNPLNWSQPDTRTSRLTDRGFTGHEHMDDFGLINMNGRVYDPDLGLFLSPDPVLQDPANALNYNRYSYVLNNPLKYTDPSGYLFYYKGAWISNYKDWVSNPFGSSGGGCFESPATGGGSRRGDSRLDAYSAFVKSLGTGGIELVITYTDWYQNKGTNGEFVKTNTSVKITITINSRGFSQVSSTADGNYGPYREGYRYGNPVADIVTAVGSAAGIYKNLPAKMVPIIAKHYGDVNFKFATPIGRIGTIGDAISTIGAVNNLINIPSSVECWTDAVFTGFGWVPVYGDFTALLYSGAKDQIQTIQDNVNNNRNPLQGTYVPGTGDIWFGF